MKTFRCDACAANKIESRWEHHHTESFCPNCGRPGTEIVEWVCTECAENPEPFDAPRQPVAKCPACGLDCARVVYPVGVNTHTKFYNKIDKAVADQKSMPTPPNNRFTPQWLDAQSVGNKSFSGAADNFAAMRNAPALGARTHAVWHKEGT